MKITKGLLKKIISEELQEVEGAGYGADVDPKDEHVGGAKVGKYTVPMGGEPQAPVLTPEQQEEVRRQIKNAQDSFQNALKNMKKYFGVED